MKIAFSALYDGRDVARGSGTFYHLCKELEGQGHELVYVAPPKTNYSVFSKVIKKYVNYAQLPYPGYLDPFVATSNAQQVTRCLKSLDFDWLITNDFGIAGFVTTSTPIVLYTDVVFPHDNFSEFQYKLLPIWLKRYFRFTIDVGLKRTSIAAFPSTFAFYHAQKYKSHARMAKIPFGANIPDPGPSIATQRSINFVRRQGEIRLLYVGYNWAHKNGDIVVQTVNHLNSLGIKATLSIVGAPLDFLSGYQNIKNYGRIDKNNLADFQKIDNLYKECDVLMVPSRYEGFGIVFAEAAAYGLPSLAYRNSGVATSIQDGVSGVLLEPGASPRDFANVILRWLNSPDEYARLTNGARMYYEQNLNWSVVVRALTYMMAQNL